MLREEGIPTLCEFLSCDSDLPLGSTRDSHIVITYLLNACLHLDDSCDIRPSWIYFCINANFIDY